MDRPRIYNCKCAHIYIFIALEEILIYRKQKIIFQTPNKSQYYQIMKI